MDWSERVRRALDRAPGKRLHLGLVAVLAVALYAGLVGIDFGTHWDESGQMRLVVETLARGELVPQWYSYPSFCFDLNLLHAAAAWIPKSLVPAALGLPEQQSELAAAIGSQAFLLQNRALYLCYALLGVVSIYALARRWSGSRAEATVAGAVLGLSWELGYHARWVAPDAVMAATAALSILCLDVALARASSRWLLAGAAAAGVVCSTKYPGGLMLLPVALAALIVARDRRAGARAGLHLAAAVAVFALAYLAVTPGTLLDYRRFFSHVRREYVHYHEWGHPGGHGIEGGLPHLKAAIEYLLCAVPSRFAPVGAIFGALSALGAAAALRTERRRALVFLAFPLAYVLFMSRQKVFIARNLLVVAPFVALFAARGAAVAVRAARRFRGGDLILGASIAALLLVNAGWLVWAGRSVARDVDPVTALAEHLADHPGQRFVVTPGVEKALRQRLGSLPAGVTTGDARPGDVALFFASEAARGRLLDARHHDTALFWFGSYEVNYNYYPTWQGRDRIVAMELDRARALQVVPGR